MRGVLLAASIGGSEIIVEHVACQVTDDLEYVLAHAGEGNLLLPAWKHMRLDNPYFFPMYELAQELDLAMCFHAGNNSFPLNNVYGKDGGFARGKLPVVSAFHTLLITGIPSKYPGLRWGFIETSAQWIPYALNDLAIRFKRKGKRLSDTVMADNNFYVACQEILRVYMFSRP